MGLKALMQSSAAASYPNEACGLVLQVGKKSIPVQCRNTSEHPKTQFLIAQEDYDAALEQGEVIGVWHTHVNTPASPSEADRVGCEASDVPWFILSIYQNEAGEFSFSEIEKVTPSGFVMPYVGRPYVFGVLDCWSLVQDYYAREFSITLDSFPRIPKFWNTEHRFFEDNWEAQGFVRLCGVEPVVGDLLMIQADRSGVVNHICLYAGNDQILHHCEGRLSRHDVYGGFWQKHTSHHLRHKTQC